MQVALVTLMPASAALAGEPMFNFSQPTPIEMAVDEMPLFSGTLSDESRIVRVLLYTPQYEAIKNGRNQLLLLDLRSTFYLLY
jgi:hypothetical protein